MSLVCAAEPTRDTDTKSSSDELFTHNERLTANVDSRSDTFKEELGLQEDLAVYDGTSAFRRVQEPREAYL